MNPAGKFRNLPVYCEAQCTRPSFKVPSPGALIKSNKAQSAFTIKTHARKAYSLEIEWYNLEVGSAPISISAVAEEAFLFRLGLAWLKVNINIRFSHKRVFAVKKKDRS